VDILKLRGSVLGWGGQEHENGRIVMIIGPALSFVHT
jgi:hypothetical protein